MRVARVLNLFSAFLLFCCIGTAAAADPAQVTATLTSSDCVKCHEQPPKDIAAHGGKHKTEVTCQDCHVGHPPKVKKPIPLCSQCHEGKPHFKLQGCLGCHKNPHTPKIISFGNNVTDPCLTCHTQHGRKPACTECHKSHSNDIVAKDCSACHKAHQPKNVNYKSDVPSKFCAACHKKAFTLLTASPAKHSKLACVYCHQAKHKTVPQCTQCHVKPHPAAILAKFNGKCGECHSIAHDLNHWSEKAAPAAAPKAEEAKPAAKKAPAKK